MSNARACLVIGAGALGGPIALALAAQGIPVAVIDDDSVEVSNLPRQIQFRDAHVGRPKVAALREVMLARGASPAAVTVEAARFTAITAPRLLADAALVIDASDSPATKFLTCDLALARRLPYVIAAALGEAGNVFVGGPGHACYRCLFESPPEDAASCASAGVLGPICGMVAQRAADLAADIWQGRPVTFGVLARAALVASSPWRTNQLARRSDCVCARPRQPLAVFAHA